MKRLNLKDFKQIKNGRWINKHTGYFVDSKMARKLNKLAKKSTKSPLIRKHRREPHAFKKCLIRVYGPKSKQEFSIDFGQRGFKDSDLLYFGHYFINLANEDVKRDIKDWSDKANKMTDKKYGK